MASVLDLKKDFENLVTRGRLSHAYLLFGEARGAQRAFSHSLARFVETAAWEGDAPLLDAMFVDGSEQELGIEVARQVQHFLYQTPVKSNRRTLVIHAAEELTVPAEQAILKIAEEPPEHAFMVLTVPDPTVLLPALASRFQKLFLAGEPDPASSEAQALASKFFEENTAGRRELLKELVEDEQLVYDFLRAVMARLKRDPLGNATALRELLKRLTALRQWNTNRRLQMEAALLSQNKT